MTKPIRIATFNINDINRRLDNLLAWFAAAASAIVCMQELKAADSEFPEQALREAGYDSIWHRLNSPDCERRHRDLGF